MAITCKDTTGLTKKALILHPNGTQVWKVSAPAGWTNLSGATFADCTITLAEAGATGFYSAEFPAGITDRGSYPVAIFSSPTAFTNTPTHQGVIEWSGAAEITFADATVAAAVKAKTDNLPATPANEATVANVKAKTDNLPAQPAAVGSAMTLANGSITTDAIAAGALNGKGDWMLAGTYVAPDNASVVAIKAKTDLLGTNNTDSPRVITMAAIVATNLDAKVSTAGGTGSGPYALTVTVTDGTDPLPGVTASLVSGVTRHHGTTDISGEVIFNVEAGTWTLGLAKSGYTPDTVPDEIEVVDDDVDAARTMTAVAVVPSSTGRCTCSVLATDDNGYPESGRTIQYRIIGSLAGTGRRMDREWQTTAASGSSGIITAEVPDAVTAQFRTDANGPEIDVEIAAGVTSLELPDVLGKAN